MGTRTTFIVPPVSTLATYSYDNLARRTGIARLNGVATTYGYDDGSRLDELY